MDAHGLLPERDYQWSFSLDHEKSIRDVVEQKTDAAAIASDVLARLVNTGEVDKAAIATIYESESFPPATIGFAYNLKPELQDAIQQSMLGFDWSDTELQSEFGPMGAEKFVAVNYKDDWANIRRIERSIDKARSGL
jgi:phosphonate transport system substrate-binding protein